MRKCEHCGHPNYRLNDWDNDWDYEAVLRDHEVVVEELSHGFRVHGHQLVWKQGFMHIPTDNGIHARKAAALFIELWLRGFSASFADKLMDGYLSHLEAQ